MNSFHRYFEQGERSRAVHDHLVSTSGQTGWKDSFHKELAEQGMLNLRETDVFLTIQHRRKIQVGPRESRIIPHRTQNYAKLRADPFYSSDTRHPEDHAFATLTDQFALPEPINPATHISSTSSQIGGLCKRHQVPRHTILQNWSDRVHGFHEQPSSSYIDVPPIQNQPTLQENTHQAHNLAIPRSSRWHSIRR